MTIRWLALSVSAWLVACGAAVPDPTTPPRVPVGSGSASPPVAPSSSAPKVATEVPEVVARGGATPEATAAAMSRAVLAADLAAYLGLVAAADDPTFVVEQRNWALDLLRQKPVELAISLEPPEVDGDLATAPFEMTWRMEGQREARKVRWPARFVRRPASSGEDAWFYAGEQWIAAKGRGVVVLHPKGFEPAARTVLGLLPDIRDRVHASFGVQGDSALAARPQTVKLYPSTAHLQASIYLSYTAPLAGWNEPGESIKLLTSPTAGREISSVLAHEYAHVATFELGPKANDMPWWVLEGIAELVSAETRGAAPSARSGAAIERRMKALARKRLIVSWDKLADFYGEAQKHMAAVYEQGHAMLAFVTARHGRESRRAWLEKMARGATLDAATRDALGTSFEDLDRTWRASIGVAER
jgi:hypothetical protein